MGAAREKDQADFDLERFVNLFDEAMTSQDPRVMETLRSLMMIVALTRPESTDSHLERKGPLRRAFEDMHHVYRRLEQLEDNYRSLLQRVQHSQRETAPGPNYGYDYPYEKYSLAAEKARQAGMVPEKINPDLLNQLKSINGGKVKGLLDK